MFQIKKSVSSDEAPVTVDTERKQTVPDTSQSEAVSDKDAAVLLTENSEIHPHGFSRTTVDEDQHVASGVGSIAESPSPGTILNVDLENDAGHIEAVPTTQIEAVASDSNGEITHKDDSNAHEGTASLPATDLESAHVDLPTDFSENTVSGDAKSPSIIRNEGSQISSADALDGADTQPKGADLKVESSPDQQRHPERSTVISSEKVQEQLDEVKYVIGKLIGPF